MADLVDYEFSYKFKMTPLERDIRLEDLHPLSPWREHLIKFGLGPVVYWARIKDGREIGTPTIDFLTKGARRRADQKRRGHSHTV